MCKRFWYVLAGLLLLACACNACEPEATPLPPNLEPPIADATAVPTDEAPAELRYAVTADTLPYLSPADKDLITAHAGIIPIDAPINPADLGNRYDIVVSLSDFSDASTAPTPLTVSLLIDATLPPLDDSTLANVVRRAIEPDANAPALRSDLANAGYPDGFDLTLTSEYAPGADVVAQALSAIGIDTRITTNPDDPAHITLTTASALADAIPLLTIPIYFRAIDGLTLTFTPSGFPLAQR